MNIFLDCTIFIITDLIKSRHCEIFHLFPFYPSLSLINFHHFPSEVVDATSIIWYFASRRYVHHRSSFITAHYRSSLLAQVNAFFWYRFLQERATSPVPAPVPLAATLTSTSTPVIAPPNYRLDRPSASPRRRGHRLWQPWTAHIGASQDDGRWVCGRGDGNDSSFSSSSGCVEYRGRARGLYCRESGEKKAPAISWRTR